MAPMPDYFELFHLPVAYTLDQAVLRRVYQEHQAVLHPDHYATQGPLAKKLSAQQSAYVNEAYRVLSDPLKRAAYLLSLSPVPSALPERALSADFLGEHLEWRALIEETEACGYPELRARLKTAFHQLERDFEQAFERKDMNGAAENLSKMKFFSRLLEETRVSYD